LVTFDAVAANAQRNFGFACFGVTRFLGLNERGRTSDNKEESRRDVLFHFGQTID
jgi:hypothetical protein